jgi:hypothetical protein
VLVIAYVPRLDIIMMAVTLYPLAIVRVMAVGLVVVFIMMLLPIPVLIMRVSV